MQSQQISHSQLLIIANRLTLKALKAPTIESLRFIILNDTIHMIFYDTAQLIRYEDNKASLEGVSGHTHFEENTEVNDLWTKAIHEMGNPEQAAKIEKLPENSEKMLLAKNAATYWLPLKVNEKVTYFLVIQKYKGQIKGDIPNEPIEVVKEFLLPAFQLALKRKIEKKPLGRLGDHLWSKKSAFAIAILLALFIVHVPLRVVTPCEVIPKTPYVVTAPLEGIIEEITVAPGQEVKEGDTLFEYDKRIPLRKLSVIQKEVDILQSEVDRATTLGLNRDPESLNALAVLKLRLEKGKLELQLAETQASQLTVTSPTEGIAIIDDPSEWRGKPVSVGEKVLSVTNPNETKVRFWIPEKDNIVFDPEKPIRVVLNVSPNTTYEAQLIYVAGESTLSEKNVPSFIAEANWIDPPEHVKIGLEGTAILYGNNVSLFYFLFRKPWAYTRYLVGI